MAAIEKETFARLVREYTPSLYRLALGILHNRDDAQDVVSESVLKAYEKLHTLQKREAFHAWIMQITANEAKRVYAKNKRRALVENIEDYMPAFEDEYHELWDIVMKIDIVYRETVILYFYEQFSIKEIAQILHIPEGTVKSRLSRAKKQLKEYLK
ncbi:MAG: RNA polymerase sigma factor [Bacillus sp. (in: Bacteria)]|nr:RNA polymerase sigma factor [Bacillus sp. (in: firmicutes)]MCM1427517.1 RNA polymerase sigma factor [Eubacterium sp.]